MSISTVPEAKESRQYSSEGSSACSTGRFGMPLCPMDIESVKQSRIPKKTQANTSWVLNLWRQWSQCRAENILPAEIGHQLDSNILW